MHGLDHRQTQTGVADRVEEEAIARLERREAQARDLADATQPLCADADEVERDALRCVQVEVGPQAAAARREIVDDDDAALRLAAVVHTLGDGDPVVDDPRRRRAAVPHQGVERGDVDEQDVRILDRVPRVGRVLTRGVMLDIEPRQAALLRAQELVLVDLPMLPVLEQDGINLEVADFRHGHLDDGVLIPLRPATGIATGRVALDRDVEAMAGPCQRVEIASVDVPGQDAEAAHETRSSERSWRVASATTCGTERGTARCRSLSSGAQRRRWASAPSGKMTTLRTRRAAAKCETPVSLLMTRSAPSSSQPSVSR